MPKTRPPYPPAFRLEAVRLVHSSEKSLPAIAAGRPLGSIGVSEPRLRNWVKQAAIDDGERDGLTTGDGMSYASCGARFVSSNRSGIS